LYLNARVNKYTDVKKCRIWANRDKEQNTRRLVSLCHSDPSPREKTTKQIYYPKGKITKILQLYLTHPNPQ